MGSNKRRRKLRARPRDLTPREARFVRWFAETGNATRAAELAGYRGRRGSNQLSVQGHRLLDKPRIRRTIRDELEALGYSAKFAARLLMGGMTATRVQIVPGDNGKPVAKKYPDYPTRLRTYDRVERLDGSAAERGAEAASSQESNLPPPPPRYSRLSATDRILMRSCADKLVAIIELGTNEHTTQQIDASDAGASAKSD